MLIKLFLEDGLKSHVHSVICCPRVHDYHLDEIWFCLSFSVPLNSDRDHKENCYWPLNIISFSILITPSK